MKRAIEIPNSTKGEQAPKNACSPYQKKGEAIEMLTRFEDKRLDRLAAIATKQFAWYGQDLKEILSKRDLIEDVYQSLYACAVQAWRDGLDPDIEEDVRETRRRARREIYACLRTLGFARPRGESKFAWREIPYSYLCGANRGINEDNVRTRG